MMSGEESSFFLYAQCTFRKVDGLHILFTCAPKLWDDLIERWAMCMGLD